MSCKLELLHTYIDPEQLPWDYQELIEIVGLEKALQIADRMGGSYQYLEKLDTILMPAKRAYILEQFATAESQVNVRQLARDTGLCVDTVYEILRKRNVKEVDKSGWKQEGLL